MNVVELLVALIRNECVNDGTPEGGHEQRSVETVVDFLGEPGRVFEPLPGRQSVVYRVPGDRGGPSLLLLGHLDVVPANPDTWTLDPFGGVQRDGFVWGRGAVDMLNQTSSMAAVFRRYLQGDAAPLPGDLVFAAVADEEGGGVYGVEHILDEAPEVLDAGYVLTEIGAPHLPTPSGPGLPVTVAEKGPFWRNLHASGVPGHASQPHRTRSAIAPMTRALHRLGEEETPVAITPEWRRFAAALGLGEAFTDPDRIDEAIAGIEEPGFARWVHACTHMTVIPTVVAAGTKANVIADNAEAEIDIRILPGQDAASVDDYFRKALGPDLYDELDWTDDQGFDATGSPAEGPLWDALETAHQEVVGEGVLVPTLIPVGTDARFLRERGAIAYGAAIFDEEVSFGDLLAMFHGNDERVSERSLELTVDFYGAMIEAFRDTSSG